MIELFLLVILVEKNQRNFIGKEQEQEDRNPTVEPTNEDFLWKLLGSLRQEQNRLSKVMYDVVWLVETQRGTHEY